jgi:two-component system, OmpR family, sensor histidine kinase KdpD
MINNQPITNDPSATNRRVRVLVALGINPYSQRLLHTAAQLARGLDGELLAIHVALPATAGRLYQTNLQYQCDLARKLGAQVETVQGSDVAQTLVDYAQQQGVTQIVLGQSDVSRWHEITRGSIVNRMLRLIQNQRAGIDLYVVSATTQV